MRFPTISAIAIASVFLFDTVLSATPAEWRGRSIYQVFTDRFAPTDSTTKPSCPSGYGGYCGGTWQGIISKLDYIQVSNLRIRKVTLLIWVLEGMGFTAIWISPVVEQVADPSRGYHGYSAQDLYSVNTNFGSADDLKALAAALNSRRMVRVSRST